MQFAVVKTRAWLQRTWVYCFHILSSSQPSDLIRNCLPSFWKAAWICSSVFVTFIVSTCPSRPGGLLLPYTPKWLAVVSLQTTTFMFTMPTFPPNFHFLFLSQSLTWLNYSLLSSAPLFITVSEPYLLLHWILCKFFSLFWLQLCSFFLISCHLVAFFLWPSVVRLSSLCPHFFSPT